MRRKSHVGLVDFYEDEDDEKPIRYCEHCLSFASQVKLGPKILLNGEQRQSDHDQFLSCQQCGNTYPVYEAASTPQIKDSAETIDNAFEQGKFVSESIPNRASVAGKKATARRRRNEIKLDDDPEIDNLLRIYGDRVKVLK